MVTFNEKFNNERKDHFFGGDYNHFCARLIKFFNALKGCKVVPIIVWESKVTHSSQMDKKLTRLNVTSVQQVAEESKPAATDLKGENVSHNSSLAQTEDSSEASCQATGSTSLVRRKPPSTQMWPKVMACLISTLKIKQKASFYEADDLLAKVADKVIKAPILSNDSDFFFLDFSGGVISMTSLLNDHRVLFDETAGVNYIACKRYTISQFEGKFYLDPALLPIVAVPMLEYEFTPILVALTRESNRMNQMFVLFQWLSIFSTADEAITFLKNKYSNFKNLKTLIEEIEHLNLMAFAKKEKEEKAKTDLKTGDQGEKDKNNSDNDVKVASKSDQVSSKIDAVFEEACDARDANAAESTNQLPKYVAENALSGEIYKRILYILVNRKDIFYPVVEDHSLQESCRSCSTKLCRQIYALLRRSEDLTPGNPANQITQYYANEAGTAVDPLYLELTSNRKLPTVWEVEKCLSVESRQALFWSILEVEPSLKGKMLIFFQKHLSNNFIDDLTELTTMILSFAYFSRNLTVDLSLEFIYSLLLNVLLSGHTAVTTEMYHFPEKLLNFKNFKIEGLSKYDFVPMYSHGGLTVRVTHYSNAFQNCLEDILFLAQVLDIQEFWSANGLIFGLHGTFVYNLTKELLNKNAPWTFLKETVLVQKEEDAINVWPLYEDLVRLALEFSGRQFDAPLLAEHQQQQLQQQKMVIPAETKLANPKKGEAKKLITRGFRSKQSSFFPNQQRQRTANERQRSTPDMFSFPRNSRYNNNNNNQTSTPTAGERVGNWRQRPGA